jgi:hypothetical protein
MMFFLDGGWRILNGQIPHRDFSNPIGPLTYCLIAFGMILAPPSTASIAYGSALLVFLLTPIAWYLARARLPAALAFLFCMFLAVLLTAPRPLGYPILETTYAMLYNRQGYVLLSMLLIGLYIPRRDTLSFGGFTEGLSCGLILALLFYCKVTYFMAAAFAVVLAFVLFRRFWFWISGLVLGIIFVCLAFLVFLHISPITYISDVVTVVPAQSAVIRLRLGLTGVINNLPLFFLTFFFLTWATTTVVSGDRYSGFAKIKTWIIITFILVIGCVIGMGNAAQGGGIQDPLFFSALLIFLEHYRRCWTVPPRFTKSVPNMFCAIALAVCLPFFCGEILVRDVTSLSYSFAWNLWKRPSFPASRHIRSATLGDFLVPARTDHVTAYWLARDHPDNINDGIDLLRPHVNPSSRVACIAFANPFSFALEVLPPKGGPLWWDLNFSFDRNTFPPPEQFLSDATLVMIPRLTDRSRGCCFETVDVMMELYGDYLEARFYEADRSAKWRLLARR